MEKVLAVSDLSRVYGDTVAVDGISFDVARNEIVGLLGPNGAGKTTTINIILGVLTPIGGTISKNPSAYRRNRCAADVIAGLNAGQGSRWPLWAFS